MTLFGFEIPLPVLVLGAITGMTYGLLSVGLVLVYRTSRIINFAHGEVGAFGAAFFGTAVLRWHLPYYVAMLLAFAVAGAMATLAEIAVVRRLRHAPRLMSIVATLGVGQFLVFFSAAFNPSSSAGFTYPSPPGLPEFTLGALRLTQAYVGMLVFGPLIVAAMAVFLRRSRFGMAMRASAANPEAARLAGIFTGRMSSLAWALAGMVSAFTAILVLPSRGYTTGESFGPTLLLRAMVGAVVARMTNLPTALAAGVGLGVIEQLLLWNYPRAGFVEVALFLIVLVALLLQPRVEGREEEKGTWAALEGWRPLPIAVARLREIRLARWAIGAIAIAAAVLMPAVASNHASAILAGIMAFGVVGLSVGVITGLGGQLSLGQFALGGIGAVISFQVSRRDGSFPLAFLAAGLGAAIVSVAIGLPALRIRGLMLAVSTLGFSLVLSNWLLQQPWALGEGVDPGRPIVFGKALDSGRSYYYVVLALLVLTMVLAHNIRRSGLARLLVAVRDNEEVARAFTVRARVVRLQGFLLAGFLAGVGGAAYGHMLSRIGPATFPTARSIDVVAMAVIGGMSLLAGPLVGAFYVIGIPAFVPLDSAGLAAQKLGWLVLVLYLPGGFAQGVAPLRDRFVRWVARRNAIDLDGTDVDRSGAIGELGGVVAPATRVRPSESVLLEGVGLTKRFGGITAVDGVSLQVLPGEIVGLIGPNGAGKTTLFELLGGFTRPDAGRVFFDGEDISDLEPEARGRRGLIRSFQDAALFPTMTVLDAARLSFERVSPTSFFGSVLGATAQERSKDRAARELIGAMGLDAYRDRLIRELSTGTRRITEIACLLALQPTLLLLDEPSAGIAQREAEALGELLLGVAYQFDIAMLVIEHDIPLIRELSVRIVAMDAGRVIAVGDPESVLAEPAVAQAYFGGTPSARRDK